MPDRRVTPPTRAPREPRAPAGRIAATVLGLLLAVGHDGYADDSRAIRIGLDADMSSGAAVGGESIRRGAVIAIDEVNAAGGVLGRRLELVVRDHRGNPARGRDNIDAFGEMDDLVAVLGGVHTPVAMHELEAVHRHRLIYLGPWAAGTPVVDNGYDPNYVFRISVRDEFAGGFLVEQTLARGFRRPALLLERTGWGRSNATAMMNALAARGLAPVAVRWFNWGVNSVAAHLADFAREGADAVLLVANAREGAVVIENMADRPPERRIPIVSHWGVSSGDFSAIRPSALSSVDLSFLQTFSFLDPPHPDRAQRVFDAYRRLFRGVETRSDVVAPVGTAHAYDLVHLLARAIEMAGTIERPLVREALLSIDHHRGLVRDYSPPFEPGRHDALSTADFRLARFSADGSIVPLVGETE